MPEYFKWEDTDTFVKKSLTEEEISQVAFWSVVEYEFSVHIGHEGWPLYIVPPGKRGKQPMPKMFLRKDAYDGVVHDKGGWLAGQKAVSGGGEIAQDAKKVVKANLALFQKIAENFYPDTVEEKTDTNSNSSSFKSKGKKKGEVIPSVTQTAPNTLDTLLTCKCGKKIDKTKHAATDMEGKTYKCPACGKSIYAK